MLALALWQKNFLFMVFVVVAWLVIVSLAGRFPNIWEFKIDEDGVSVGLPNSETKKFYSYSEINSFDICPADKEYNELVLKFKSRFTPLLKINIHSGEEEKIKNFLLKFLEQKEAPPSLIDSILRLIRF